jgi:hypothetical protein
MEQHSVLTPNTPVMRKFETPRQTKSSNLLIAVISFVVVAAGIGTGWLISGKKISETSNTPVAQGIKVSQNEAGLADESQFSGESPVGMLEEGGIDGEGTHRLIRDGGPSKSVYLTSSVVDLQSFVGKKVQVWGETIAPKKAGWLMDVAKIKVVD